MIKKNKKIAICTERVELDDYEIKDAIKLFIDNHYKKKTRVFNLIIEVNADTDGNKIFKASMNVVTFNVEIQDSE